MKEELISFQTAKKAKEKGFPQRKRARLGKYNQIGDIIKPAAGYGGGEPLHEDELWEAPTQSLLRRWLREKHDINLWMDCWGEKGQYYHVEDITRGMNDWIGSGGKGSTSFEKALEEGLYEALNHI